MGNRSTRYPPEFKAEAGFFVGRERELGQLEAGLAGALSGRGRLFLVDGIVACDFFTVETVFLRTLYVRRHAQSAWTGC